MSSRERRQLIFFCVLRKKNELKLPTPSQALPDSPGGAYRTVNHGSGVSETPLHSVSPTLRLEPYCALRKNSSRLFMQTGRAKKMSLSFPLPVRLCLTAPVGHAEPLITVRASPRLHCIPSLQRYGLSRIALCARIRYNCQKWLVKVS